MEKTPEMAPNGAKKILFLLIQTLPTFWAERILILRIVIFWNFLDPKLPGFQVPDLQISRNLAWAELGPGRAWALGRVSPWGGPWVGPGSPSAGGALGRPLGWAPRVGLGTLWVGRGAHRVTVVRVFHFP